MTTPYLRLPTFKILRISFFKTMRTGSIVYTPLADFQRPALCVLDPTRRRTSFRQGLSIHVAL